MTKPSKLVEKAIVRPWNSVKQRALAWSLSIGVFLMSRVHHIKCVQWPRNSTGHVEKELGFFCRLLGVDVHRSSVGRVCFLWASRGLPCLPTHMATFFFFFRILLMTIELRRQSIYMYFESKVSVVSINHCIYMHWPLTVNDVLLVSSLPHRVLFIL